MTVPIGAWVGSLVFDIASRLADESATFVRGSFWLIGIGIVGALLAGLFGVLDLLAIPHHPVEGEPRHTRAFLLGILHMDLNLAAMGLYIANFFVRRGRLDEPAVGWLPLSLSVIALLFVLIAGAVGGALAYHYGVRVAAESDQERGFL